jgi:hypothetical protein
MCWLPIVTPFAWEGLIFLFMYNWRILAGIFFLYYNEIEISMAAENSSGSDREQQPAKTNNPEKAIDTSKEVEESKDAKIDQDFPGYPHYPAKEDIVNPDNSNKIDVDVEKLTRSNTITPDHLKDISE